MNKNITFTICSINYLAQAFTLGKSLEDTNPDVDFRIYVVDKFLEKKEVKHKSPFKIIEIEDLEISCFEKLFLQYDIIELNTAVKPYIFDFIFKNEQDVLNVIYFDPDIKVYNSLQELFQNLINYSIILTPHILTPSDSHPFGQEEVNFLSTGIFNLGFIGFSRKVESEKILEWWKEKLLDQGYNNPIMHTFYDQKWMNLAPVYFDHVLIEKSPGYNIAAWNLHERELTQLGDIYFVNQHPLIFYHFSGVNIRSSDISRHSKFNLDQRPDLINILKDYRNDVIKNGYDKYRDIPSFYKKKGTESPKLQSYLLSRIKKKLNLLFLYLKLFF